MLDRDDSMADALGGLQSRWIECQAQDDQKKGLFKDLFEHLHSVSAKLSEAESELCDKKDVIKIIRQRIVDLEKQVRETELEKARHAFVLVVIDGDCMPFKDELVKKGLEGGRKAARLLTQAAEEDFRMSASGATIPHIQIVVRIFANVRGLAKIYRDTDILPETTVLDEFIRGFNMGDVMCDYVDAGNGKECSDEKVKAIFRFHLADSHCRRILFGGSADNGYARLLGPYAEDSTASRQITLLEGPPFAYELAGIKDKFRIASFGNVFRTQKLVNGKSKMAPSFTPPATPSVDYATVVAKTPTVNIPASSSACTQGWMTSRGSSSAKVFRNKLDQRVDSRLEYAQYDFANLKHRRLCNSFHLLGRCTFKERYGSCQHEHGEKLNVKQMQALRAIARQSCCPTGLSCCDPDCLAGHRCLRESCVAETCWFPPNMHHVDTKIAVAV